MIDLKRIQCFLTSHVYVPSEAHSLKEPLLLHISDTPKSFFPALKHLLNTLKPEVILHTGDLVDNIKLQLYPGSLLRYQRDVSLLLTLLNTSSAKTIYIAAGNHDDLETLTTLRGRILIATPLEVLTIAHRSVVLSHYAAPLLTTSAEYNFFGHDLSVDSHINDKGQHYFNGITAINLIGLHSGKVIALAYPWGTDEERLGKRRMSF